MLNDVDVDVIELVLLVMLGAAISEEELEEADDLELVAFFVIFEDFDFDSSLFDDLAEDVDAAVVEVAVLLSSSLPMVAVYTPRSRVMALRC
jgi:hypothetical protein